MDRDRLDEIQKALSQSQSAMSMVNATTPESRQVKYAMQAMMTLLQECVNELYKHVR